MSDNLKLAVIIGSVREGRFGPVVASWFADQARLHGEFDVDVIDLAEAHLPLQLPAVPPAMDPHPARPDGMAELTERLDAADAFVIVTPDYNRSFPAALKAAIDWHFTQWSGKTVGFVGYSGASGGLLAIEGLRQVFNELDAHTVREYVSFPRYYLLFDEDGALREPDEPAAAARGMLDRLQWWARALAAARAVPALA
ncbi:MULTISPECIES: NADPH-dependent FMN reductase [unclassified Rhodococcus (in: high G+C Gram-positive bacteria)]|uniref:NADPH-dependent FMN reductase n=1 Tax=unclassified Rhodococcus (in: high G+C Gram-positive bacteria) TaxID=192944 RepID=UPI000BC97E85|nr:MULTISPECIES: NAD(P)H-dependent oxidoreductase [unclassified Rhodococcus (in: high G+C Gram-positive bacteria)]MBP1161929.1 NAD(P)H-dependent FMN reductase [Rhodococcus sp. PvR099]PTR43361.1 NAD(P)H-dependent FMN reductase [Rhodococcus sp. OK611]SNX91224.1 NAD(P)H-dependent FMN reductase [Rhodococcus sp. OK270]